MPSERDRKWRGHVEETNQLGRELAPGRRASGPGREPELGEGGGGPSQDQTPFTPLQFGRGERSGMERVQLKALEIAWAELEDARTQLRLLESVGRDHQQLVSDLERTRATLKAVVAALPVSIWVAHDKDATVITANAEGYRQLRLPVPSDPMSEKHYRDPNVSPSSPTTRHLRFLAEGSQVVPCSELPIQKAAGGVEVRASEMELRFDDGTSTWVSINAVPIKDKEGKPVGSVAASLDITPVKQKQRELAASEARYRALVSANTSIVFSRDSKLCFVTPQPAWEQFTGQTFEQYRGLGWMDAIHPDDRAGVAARVEQAAKDGQAYRGRGRMWRVHPWAGGDPGLPGEEGRGEWRHCEATAAPVTNSAGEATEWVGMVVDRTEQHLAAAALEDHARALARSNRELAEFAQVVAHDIKEPLRGVRLLASFIEEDTKERLDPDSLARLKKLEGLCAKMHTLVQTVLDSAAVSGAPLRLERVRLTDLVADAVNLLGPRLQDVGAEVVTSFGSERALLYCDRTHMTRVLTNLVLNGVKYNESENKRIEIAARDTISEGRRESLVSVKDNGIGIPSHQVGSIFQMFRRLHPSERYGGGVGAGLAIVHKVIERHRGRVWVESVPGEGSTFYFTVPLE